MSEKHIVDVNQLCRWQHSCQQEVVSNDAEPLQSKFNYNKEINNKIILWDGDMAQLNVHAITCCTTETLRNVCQETRHIVHSAGAEMKQELMKEVKSCQTGEVRVTRGYRLPARYVLHTVGPCYNIRYRTAAESTLYNCYRNILNILREYSLTSLGLCCIHSLARNYPVDNGAHIAIRTVRRFLEKHANDIDVIVFVVNQETKSTYATLLPLYFPRSAEEQQLAAQQLPLDVGDDDGQPVIAERQIRISANPAKNSLIRTANEADDQCVDDNDINEVFESSVSIGDHAFSKMEEDIDQMRLQSRKQHRTMSQEERDVQRSRYNRLLNRAKTEQFEEFDRLRFLYQTGLSLHGHPVMLLLVKHLPVRQYTPEKMLLYFIRQMDSFVNKKFIMVIAHTLSSSDVQPTLACLKHYYNTVDYRYKKNLYAIYMLHTGVWTKMSFWWFLSFTAPELKCKVHYLQGIEQLYSKVTPDQLELPDFVVQHDLKVNGIRYFTRTEDEL